MFLPFSCLTLKYILCPLTVMLCLCSASSLRQVLFVSSYQLSFPTPLLGSQGKKFISPEISHLTNIYWIRPKYKRFGGCWKHRSRHNKNAPCPYRIVPSSRKGKHWIRNCWYDRRCQWESKGYSCTLPGSWTLKVTGQNVPKEVAISALIKGWIVCGQMTILCSRQRT